MAETKDGKRVFEVGGVKYAVIRPNIEKLTAANKLRRETFNSELQVGSLIRDQLEEELRKRSLWSDDREARYQQLRKEVVDMEYQLASGGIKLSEAKTIALKMKSSRNEMVELLSSRSDLDSNTCEGRADAARFNYLFANCLVYEKDSKPFFENGLTGYLLNQDNPVAVAGATEFFYLISDTEDVDEKLPENKFLKQFNFVDDEYRLVDKQGKYVDEDGRHIDVYGNYIEWISEDDFVFVDANGRVLDDSGNFKVTFSPFLDDEGKPLDENGNVIVEKEKPKPKRTRKTTKKTTPKQQEKV